MSQFIFFIVYQVTYHVAIRADNIWSIMYQREGY